MLTPLLLVGHGGGQFSIGSRLCLLLLNAGASGQPGLPFTRGGSFVEDASGKNSTLMSPTAGHSAKSPRIQISSTIPSISVMRGSLHKVFVKLGSPPTDIDTMNDQVRMNHSTLLVALLWICF